MANKTEELNVDLAIKQVASDDVLKDMEENEQLGANQIIVTKNDTEVPMMPVGSIFVSAIPQTDTRVHLLDGSTISQTGVYETFANLIKALEASGQPITYKDDDESTANDKFNADVSKTGNCGKFVIDNKNGTIRLPKITTFIQGLSDLTNIGSSLSAGLPNITGEASLSNSVGGFEHPQAISGAFQAGTTKNYSWNTTQATSYALKFDASKSNSIYGNSTTVQPNATQYPYYIVLASGYKSSQVVDIDNVVSDVNNIRNELNEKTRDYIVKSEPTSTGWFIKWASGLKEYWGVSPKAITHNISFSEAFASTNYAISFSPLTNNTSTDILAGKVDNTVSYVKITMSYRSTSAQGSASVAISYYAKGF